jgi:hypothetical protein
MTERHHWPFEQSVRGTLRPWDLTAAGYLAVLSPDSQEAQRAKQGLLERACRPTISASTQLRTS